MRLSNVVLGTLVVCAPVAALADEPTGSDPFGQAQQPAPPPPPLPPNAHYTPAPPPAAAPAPAAPAAAAAPVATQTTAAAAATQQTPQPISIYTQENKGAAPTYAQQGVMEFGVSAGLSLAQDIRALNIAPSLGWFMSDSFEMSAIADLTNIKAGSESATLYSGLVEPSFHVAMSGNNVFGFVGMGVGGAYVRELGGALAVAPRLGMDVRLGHAGILRPSLAYEYTTHDAMGAVDSKGNSNVALIGVSSALRFNIGYSAMW